METTDLDQVIRLDIPEGWLVEDEDEDTRLFYPADREDVSARVSVMAYQMNGKLPPPESEFAPDKLHYESERITDEGEPYVSHTWTRTIISTKMDLAFVVVLSLAIDESSATEPEIPALVATWEQITTAATAVEA